jgi:anti-anti-sigma factor
MSGPAANMSIWVGDRIVCFKVSGRANLQNSPDFKAAVNSLWAQGRVQFVLDLTECPLMDSTFLGVLAGIGLKFKQPANGEPFAAMELLNPSPRVRDLLETLGIQSLFQIADGPPMNIERLTCLERAPVRADKREMSKVCLEAHQTLMDVNPANVPKFRDVAHFLAEKLKTQEAQEQSGRKDEPETRNS